MPDPTAHRGIARSAVRLALASLFVLLCGLPYLGWLESPSLYHDDFMRVGSLRNATIGRALFRPFNEHMAPLFELVSYLAWLASGLSLEAVPTMFQVASFLAFGSTVGMLAALIRRETRSTSSTLAAVAIFGLSSVSAETVLWYSACSFQWAAAALAAWFAAASAVEATSPRARRGWLIASSLASLAAPAFSAIGILAAPIAVLRLLVAGRGTGSTCRFLLRSLTPASGLAAYLLICASFRYRQVLTESLSKNLDLGAALWATIRAPSLVLFPSLIGMRDQAWAVPGTVAAASSVVVLLDALVFWIKRRQSALIPGGIALILGGYFLAYAARARPGDLWVFEISRYHLFPQLGMVCLLVAIGGPLARRLDRGWTGGLLAATLLAAGLAGLQYRGMRLAVEGGYRFPDQPRLLALAGKLEAFAFKAGIPVDQLMRTLDPVQPRWAPHPWPFHPILFLFATHPTPARRPDSVIRVAIIESLTPEEREILFGCMGATRYRRPATEPLLPLATATLVATRHFTSVGEQTFDSMGGVASLEYRVGRGADEARSLCLPRLKADATVELWWADELEGWSADRSVRWEPDSLASPTGWVIPIEVLPHWRRGAVRKLRIVAREKMTVSVGSPSFLR